MPENPFHRLPENKKCFEEAVNICSSYQSNCVEVFWNNCVQREEKNQRNKKESIKKETVILGNKK